MFIILLSSKNLPETKTVTFIFVYIHKKVSGTFIERHHLK